jgi:hypothetical protein
MKFSHILMILLLLPVGQVMGAAAFDSDEEGDRWPYHMVRQYGEQAQSPDRLLHSLNEVEKDDRVHIENLMKKYFFKETGKNSSELLEGFVNIFLTNGEGWLQKMVGCLSSERGPCSYENLQALLTMPKAARRWVSEMTGELEIVEFTGDLTTWVPLLQRVSNPLLRSTRSERKAQGKLDLVYRQFRDSIRTQVPDALTDSYFEELSKVSLPGTVSESESEAEQ